MTSIDGVFIRLLLVLLLAVSAFSLDYFPKERRTWVLVWLAVFFFSALLLLTTSSWFSFVLGWEAVTAALLALLSVGSISMVLTYGVVQLAGVVVLLTGFASAAALAQSSISSLFPTLSPLGSGLQTVSNTWLWLGFAVKAGILGVHQWLPPVHSDAPAPISALLSGFSVTLGIWGLMRVVPGYTPALVIWGIAGVFYGGLKAWGQRDVKRLLAYSTISHTGLMLFGIGLGTESAKVAVAVHVLGHGLFKSLMFLWAGYAEKTFGTRDIYELSQYARQSLLPVVVLVVGALGLIGVPLSAGYPGKYLIKEMASELAWANLVFLGAGLVSGAYGSKLLLVALGPRVIKHCKQGQSGLTKWTGWQMESPLDSRYFPPVHLLNFGTKTGFAVLLTAAVLFGVRPSLVSGQGVPWNAASLVSEPLPVVLSVLAATAGAVLTWIVEAQGIGYRYFRYLTLGWDTGEAKWTAKCVWEHVLEIGRELHNGDITRYLQWFLAAAAIILTVIRLSART